MTHWTRNHRSLVLLELVEIAAVQWAQLHLVQPSLDIAMTTILWKGSMSGDPHPAQSCIARAFHHACNADRVGTLSALEDVRCVEALQELVNKSSPVPWKPEWRTDTAIELAELCFKGEPLHHILADALDDAGCTAHRTTWSLRHDARTRSHVGVWSTLDLFGYAHGSPVYSVYGAAEEGA